jgi:hypothetical protein
VASSPVDSDYLPGDIGDELQSLALELYDAAQVKTATEQDLFSLFFIKDICLHRIGTAKLIKKN